MLGSDRFVIERRLGEGSMGAVYLAHDRERNMRVALKTLRRVDAGGIYLFKREFRALADLSHPNLVRLHELFSSGDQWFFTMEYVEGRNFISHVLGGTLRSYSAAPKRPSDPGTGPQAQRAIDSSVDGLEMLFPSPLQDVERFCDVVEQIVQGLMAVHAAGKLHRDLKSDNVMVTEDGRAVVLDFGVVVERQGDQDATLDSPVLGTPAYMSPEQAAGREIAEATDWYSLGVMVYEALTGGLPFDGSYMEVIKRKQQEDPPEPNKVVAGVPDFLNALCMQLLARDPSARPSGPEVLRVLRLGKGASAPPNARRESVPARMPFVGRSAQRAALDDALLDTDQGRALLCLVGGASGIGKTTLVERFLQDAEHQHGAVVLRGRCYERESLPYKAIDSLIDSLCRYLRRLSPIQTAELMPRDIHALSQLFPVLKRVEGVEHVRRRRALPEDPQQLRARAGKALAEILSRIADRSPLVLFIDDLQWGDLDSAQLISDLIGAAESPALLLVCTHRSGEVVESVCLATLLERARKRPGNLRRLEVGALSHDEAVSLTRSLVANVDAAHVDLHAIARESQGNPYLLTELVRFVMEYPEEGSNVTVEAVMARRLSQLSPDARTLLQLVAVAGRPVSEEVLELASAFDINLQAALSELRAAKLVHGTASHEMRAIEPYHDRFRQAVIAEMPAELLQTWNRRLAITLEATGSPDLEALAEHLLGAGDSARAGLYAMRAAHQAALALAFDKAARLYEVSATHAGLSGAERQELLVSWADSLVSAGRGAEAVGVFFDAADQASPREAADLRRQAGIQLVAGGQVDRGLAVLRDSLRAIGLEPLAQGTDEALEQTLSLRRALRERGLAFKAQREDEIAIETLQRLDLLWSVAQALLGHQTLRALPLVARFAQEALDAGEPRRVAKGLCLYHCYIDRHISELRGQRTQGALEAAEAIATDCADSELDGWVALALGMEGREELEPQVVMLHLTRAEQLFRACGARAGHATRLSRILIADLQVALGEVAALGTLAQWAEDADQRQDEVMASRMRILSAYHALSDDDADLAHDLYRQARRGEAQEARSAEWLLGGAIALYRGDAAAALDLSRMHDAVANEVLSVNRFWRANLLWMRARLLVLASVEAHDAHALRAQASEDIRAVEDLGVLSIRPSLSILRATLSMLAGNAATALQQLDTAREARSDAVYLRANYLRGRWFPGIGAEQAMGAASETLRELGVRNPERWCRLLSSVPGIPEVRLL